MQDYQKQMDSSQLDSLYLRSTSAVSLDNRFSQVLKEQLTWSKACDPVPFEQRTTSGVTKLVRLVKKPQSLVNLQVPDVSMGMKRRLGKRRSIWTRLGPSTRKPPGFWSFRNKYRWRARSTWSRWRARSTWSRWRTRSTWSSWRARSTWSQWRARSTWSRGGRPGQRRFLRTTDLHNMTAGGRQPGPVLQQDRSRQRRFSRADVPTRKQLDAQLDRYMSLTRSRLDRDLDDYMSMSQSRLDAQLDQYMLMAASGSGSEPVWTG